MNKKQNLKEEEKKKEKSPPQNKEPNSDSSKNINEVKPKQEKGKPSKPSDNSIKKVTTEKKPSHDNIESKKKYKDKAEDFQTYLADSGLPKAFDLVFSELVSKGIKQEKFFSYTAMRLRQIGNEIEEIKYGSKTSNI